MTTPIPQNLTRALIAVAVVLLAGGAYLFVGNGHVIASASTCERLLERWKTEKSENLGAKETYSGAIAPVKYATSNFPEASDFKMEINDGVEKGANFNGHYSIVEWSCGEDCQNHAVIDVRTGDVLTFGVVSARGLGYSIDSPVLVVNPEDKMFDLEIKNMTLDDAVYWATLPREYHVIEESSTTEAFRLLCAENPFEAQEF